jgi:hypothetical protein
VEEKMTKTILKERKVDCVLNKTKVKLQLPDPFSKIPIFASTSACAILGCFYLPYCPNKAREI